LLPPYSGDERSSRFNHKVSTPNASARPAHESTGVGHTPIERAPKAARIIRETASTSGLTIPRVTSEAMRVSTDYIRHAARAARKCAGSPLGDPPQAPDPEFYKTLAQALEEIVAGLEQVGKED
jgi:hypothetical protein